MFLIHRHRDQSRSRPSCQPPEASSPTLAAFLEEELPQHGADRQIKKVWVPVDVPLDCCLARRSLCNDWLTATPFPLGAAIVQARCYFQHHVLNPLIYFKTGRTNSPRIHLVFLLNFPMTNFIESSSEQSELSSDSPRLTQADCSNPAPLPMDVSNDLTGTLRRNTVWMSWRTFYYVLRAPNMIEYKNNQSAISRSTKPLKIYFLKDLQLSAPDSARLASTFALQHLQSSRRI